MTYSDDFKLHIAACADGLDETADRFMRLLNARLTTYSRVECIRKANRRYDQAQHLRHTFISPTMFPLKD